MGELLLIYHLQVQRVLVQRQICSRIFFPPKTCFTCTYSNYSKKQNLRLLFKPTPAHSKKLKDRILKNFSLSCSCLWRDLSNLSWTYFTCNSSEKKLCYYLMQNTIFFLTTTLITSGRSSTWDCLLSPTLSRGVSNWTARPEGRKAGPVLTVGSAGIGAKKKATNFTSGKIWLGAPTAGEGLVRKDRTAVPLLCR